MPKLRDHLLMLAFSSQQARWIPACLCQPVVVLGLWENSASTANTGELLGTERVQNPMHTTPAVFLSGTVITVLTVIGSDEQCSG